MKITNLLTDNKIKDKLSKRLISEVFIKLVAFRINGHPKSSFQFQKG